MHFLEFPRRDSIFRTDPCRHPSISRQDGCAVGSLHPSCGEQRPEWFSSPILAGQFLAPDRGSDTSPGGPHAR